MPRNLTFDRPGAVFAPMFPLQARTIRGFCHLYDGQEAVATGVEAALNHQVRCGTLANMAEALFEVLTEMRGVRYDFAGGRLSFLVVTRACTCHVPSVFNEAEPSMDCGCRLLRGVAFLRWLAPHSSSFYSAVPPAHSTLSPRVSHVFPPRAHVKAAVVSMVLRLGPVSTKSLIVHAYSSLHLQSDKVPRRFPGSRGWG